MKACILALVLLLPACGTSTGELIVHWQRQDALGNLIPCGKGDLVDVNLGTTTQTFACDNGGSGTDAQGNKYVGGATMTGLTVGGVYNLFLQIRDGKTGYIDAQTVVPSVGYIQQDIPLNAGTVVLQNPVVSGPEQGVPDGGFVLGPNDEGGFDFVEGGPDGGESDAAGD